MTSVQIKSELEYLLGYPPPWDIVEEAAEWVQENPGSDLSEWVDAMRWIGAL